MGPVIAWWIDLEKQGECFELEWWKAMGVLIHRAHQIKLPVVAFRANSDSFFLFPCFNIKMHFKAAPFTITLLTKMSTEHPKASQSIIQCHSLLTVKIQSLWTGRVSLKTGCELPRVQLLGIRVQNSTIRLNMSLRTWVYNPKATVYLFSQRYTVYVQNISNISSEINHIYSVFSPLCCINCVC